MNLKEQRFEALRKERNKSLNYSRSIQKLEIELRKQTDCSESTVSSQFSDTTCKHMCASLPEVKLSEIETEVEYLRQILDYRSLHEVGVWRPFAINAVLCM